MTGPPISKLSTSRVFAYVSHFGAQPLGVEWIDDFSINVVFPNAAATRLALEYLCPAASDPNVVPLPDTQDVQKAADDQARYRQSAGADDNLAWSHSFVELLLLQRKCHRFPQKLFTGIEKDALGKAQELVALTEKPSEYPDDAPEIYRELEEADRVNNLQKEWTGKIKDVKTLQGAIWARFAIESADVKQKQAKIYSNWYKEHGQDAGKQVVPRLISVGAETEKRELLPDGKPLQSEAGPSNIQWGPLRLRNLASDSDARGRGPGRGQAVMDSLDSTLDNLRGIRDSSLGGPGDGRESRRSASPVQRRGRGTRQYDASALDDDMDAYNAGRTSESPPLARGEGSLQGSAPLDGSSSSFSRNGPGGRQGYDRRRYGDDVMMDVSGGSGYNSASGGADHDGAGITIKGRGRRKAPAPSAGSGGMYGWGDDDHSTGNGKREDLFAPPASRYGQGQRDGPSYKRRNGGDHSNGGRHERGNDSSSDLDTSNDIFARAGIPRKYKKAPQQATEQQLKEEAERIEKEHVGRANIMRKGGHGAGGFAAGSSIIPVSSTLNSRLAALDDGNKGLSLGDRIQTESHEDAWDQ